VWGKTFFPKKGFPHESFLKGFNMKILSIGAGRHQLPLIKAIKALGYEAAAVDINPQAVGAGRRLILSR